MQFMCDSGNHSTFSPTRELLTPLFNKDLVSYHLLGIIVCTGESVLSPRRASICSILILWSNY